jgi:hypothetical protein
MTIQLLRQQPKGFRFVLIYVMALFYAWTLLACGDDGGTGTGATAEATITAVVGGSEHSVVSSDSKYALTVTFDSFGERKTNVSYDISIDGANNSLLKDIYTFKGPESVGSATLVSHTGSGIGTGVTATNSSVIEENEDGDTWSTYSQTISIPLNSTLYASFSEAPVKMKIKVGGYLFSEEESTQTSEILLTKRAAIVDGRKEIKINPTVNAIRNTDVTLNYTHAPFIDTSTAVDWQVESTGTIRVSKSGTQCSNLTLGNSSCTPDSSSSGANGTVTVPGTLLTSAGEYKLTGTLKSLATTPSATIRTATSLINVQDAPVAKLAALSASLTVGQPFILTTAGSVFPLGTEAREYLITPAGTPCAMDPTTTNGDLPALKCTGQPAVNAQVTLKITFAGKSVASTVNLGSSTGAGS